MLENIILDVVPRIAWPRPFLRDPDTLVLHRLGPTLHDKPIEAIDDILPWFQTHQARTGRKFPYHYVVWARSTYGVSHLEIHQTLPLGRMGAAQRAWNRRAIGIAIIGDWRKTKLPYHHHETLAQFCFELCQALGCICLAGHSELSGGSGYANHVCPGEGIDLHVLRAETYTLAPSDV